MTAVQLHHRRAQLCELRTTDPLRVIEMYRRVVGLNRFCMLPGGMDYASLIESILDHEAASGRPVDSPAAGRSAIAAK